MGSSEKFCLRWNDFETNISTAFKEIREDKDFFDVTLACEDEDQISAHKVILSACSPFFRGVLKRNRHEHPLLYLKGVKYGDLVAVLNFMYHGEVNVSQEDLNTFLSVAEDLKVKGLTQGDTSSGTSNHRSATVKSSKAREPPEPSHGPAAKKARTNPPPSLSTPVTATRPPPPPATTSLPPDESDEIQDITPVKTEPVLQIPSDSGGAMVVDQYGGGGSELVDPEYGEDYGDYESGYEAEAAYDGTLADPNSSNADGNKDVSEYMVQVVEGGTPKDTWRCLICAKVIKRKYRMKDHIESLHFVGTPCHPCRVCEKMYSTKNSLEKHMATYHRDGGGGKANDGHDFYSYL